MTPPLVLSITLSKSSLSTDIFPLIAPLRPDWCSSNTHLEQFNDSITNTIFGLFDKSDQFEPLVIKIFGLKTEEFIDREAELDTLCILSEYKLVQPVLLRFANGIIYNFAPGENCNRDDIRDTKIAPLIAQQMAKLHSIPVRDKNQKPNLVPLMRKFLALLGNINDQPEGFASLCFDVDWVEQDVLPRLIPHAQYGIDLVLCHNDVHGKNILYNSSSQSISFIDFEYSGINYALFDVANHFLEYAGVDQVDFHLYPTRDEQYRWLKIYFKARNLKFHDPEEICHLTDQFAALSHLCYGLWALVQVRFVKLNYDYTSYARRRLNRFRELRSILFSD